MKRFGINALQLKILAMVFMLMDHMWATVIPGNEWMTCVGRLAFPIFAFQIAEGRAHTSDPKAYRRRGDFHLWLSVTGKLLSRLQTHTPHMPRQSIQKTIVHPLLPFPRTWPSSTAVRPCP